MAKIKTASNATKKDIILKNAAELFRKKGYRAASVRELAESLGIEAPSLYNHIGSKAELLSEICFDTAKDFTENMIRLQSSDEDASAKTASVIRFHIEKMYRDFDKVYVSDNDWKHLPRQQADEYLSQRRAYEQSLTEIIKEGVKKNIFGKINPRIAMLTILSAVRGLEFRQRSKNEFSIAELEENMVKHLLQGITK